MLHKVVERPSCRRVPEERVGAVATSRIESFWVFEHHAHEGTRKRFYNASIINRDVVSGHSDLTPLKHNRSAPVSVLVQEPPNGCARLAGLADHRLKPPRKHALGGPISPDDIEPPPQRPIKGGSENRC
jgi:hypothetical protein